ncbi:uncharacterized protein RJT20DRAFT_3170 [Scheffersomyces xylosifermentans]|uniref:uncharacterized protein n=1 Tax=Scheffersomyces xylosifermentans TaxID=1304137 RepID=UPI00315D107F
MTELITQSQTELLTTEYNILHLLYHRGRNQHRITVWWKYLNILHRQVRKIVKLSIDIGRIKSTETKKHKQQQIVDIVGYLVKRKVFTKAYYEFNGIIALGQFINLGLTLVGNLAKLHEILVGITGVKDVLKVTNTVQVQKASKSVQQAIDTGDDLGEVIEFEEVIETEVTRKRTIEDDDKEKVEGTGMKKKLKKKQRISREGEGVNHSSSSYSSIATVGAATSSGDTATGGSAAALLTSTAAASTLKEESSLTSSTFSTSKAYSSAIGPTTSIDDIFGDSKKKTKKKKEKKEKSGKSGKSKKAKSAIDDIFG